MRNLGRWMVFTAMVAMAGLALAFGMLFLGRLYGGLQNPAFILVMLVLYSIGVTLAAIWFAARLEDEELRQAERRRTGRQAMERAAPLPPRFADERDRPDA